MSLSEDEYLAFLVVSCKACHFGEMRMVSIMTAVNSQTQLSSK